MSNRPNKPIAARTITGGTIALAGLLYAVAAASDEQPADTAAPRSATQSAIVPSATCSNSHCHGGNISGDPDPDAVWRRAYTTWATRDPHADAHAVLYRQASRRMVEILNNGKQLQPQAYDEFVDARCIACHSTATSGAASSAVVSEARRDPPLASGVTCAACHGDPAAWLDDHMLDSAPEKSRAQLSGINDLKWRTSNPDYGLVAMDDEVTRARTCAKCHVGSSGEEDGVRREVNHDLLAAGHPRLAFEYTSHLANMPRHWRPPQTTTPAAYAWAVGQLVAAEAAASLLVARVESDAQAHGGVWPEFSEYACASCHHSLRDGDLRTPSQVRRATGEGAVYHWGSWYHRPLASALESLAGGEAPSIAASQSKLQQAMAPLVPSKALVAPAARELRQQLRRAIAKLSQKKTEESLASPSFVLTDPEQTIDWDHATQAYLWHAHRLASTDATDADRQALDHFLQAIEPENELNGPLWLHYQPEDVRKSLNKLEATKP